MSWSENGTTCLGFSYDLVRNSDQWKENNTMLNPQETMSWSQNGTTCLGFVYHLVRNSDQRKEKIRC